MDEVEARDRGPGMLLVRTRGAMVVQSWCNSGAIVVQQWCNGGARVVQAWSECLTQSLVCAGVR
eukprot:6300309-Alexandrium_andersonii.AAC.1